MPPLKTNSLVLTCGAGIAAEITQKAWQALKGTRDFAGAPHHFFVLGKVSDYKMAKKIDKPEQAAEVFSSALPVLELKDSALMSPATLALRSLEGASDLALEGTARALITNPINKADLVQAGFTHTGQTEFLAERAKTQSLMMLATSQMRCALVTTHLPLREVPHALTEKKIIQAGRILYTALQERFGIDKPTIGVAALNPHAGEKGLLGTEEEEIIAPACRALGEGFSAPLPADSLFVRKNFDAFLCLYHDQALIPIKMQPEPAVNITLGLPFVRTSPDHGTAEDIIGKNRASPDSLLAAIHLANKMTA